MHLRIAIAALCLTGTASVAAAQGPPAAGGDGAAVFTRACASCHQPGQTAVPPPETLRTLAPEAIVTALTTGKMAEQGKTLSAAEHRAVAQFLTGRAPAVATGPAATPTVTMCKAATPTADASRGPSWMGWGGPDPNNTRFVPKGGLTAADLPRLKMKWAFGYEGATAARIQPALAGGKLFVASDNAHVHALDPKTGCAYWTYKADTGVRSALTVGPYKTAGRSGYALFFGDGQARAYAIDTITGREIWKQKLDDHPAAGITGALTFHDGKVFVPTQGLNEEGTGGRGKTPCCTFRGSLSALDANTGKVLWKSYMIDPPAPRGLNTRSGVEAMGPAGGAIWAPATVDAKRRAVYVATGNGYADPPQKMTDAIVALDMDTGAVKWFYQATPGDQWLGGCGARSGGNPGCPEVQGPDHDFSAAPLLATAAGGRQLVIVPQKSGLAFALDPDKGTLVWQYRFGQGSGLGGVWGAAADGEHVYFGVGDGQTRNPGGVRAVKIATGEQVWSAEPPNPRLCASAPRCNASQGAAVTVIPGAVLAGSHDGGLRAYSAEDGKVLWEFDTNKTFETVNGVKATGASIDGSPLIVGDGMIYLNSGYGGIAARPGNVLLAFGID
jgi:polyvinyl alcohol dehydrogenase (cytochrome)